MRTEITGILGVYSNPGHIVAYTDGEIRQEWELILLNRRWGGWGSNARPADYENYGPMQHVL